MRNYKTKRKCGLNRTGNPALYDVPTVLVRTNEGEKRISIHELYHWLEQKTPFGVWRDSWKEIEATYWYLADILEDREFCELADSEAVSN